MHPRSPLVFALLSGAFFAARPALACGPQSSEEVLVFLAIPCAIYFLLQWGGITLSRAALYRWPRVSTRLLVGAVLLPFAAPMFLLAAGLASDGSFLGAAGIFGLECALVFPLLRALAKPTSEHFAIHS